MAFGESTPFASVISTVTKDKSLPSALIVGLSADSFNPAGDSAVLISFSKTVLPFLREIAFRVPA
ncbi:hypothetical protein D3C86_2008290 [compost metagenome]